MKVLLSIMLVVYTMTLSNLAHANEQIQISDVDYLKDFYCYQLAESPQLAIDLSNTEKEQGIDTFVKYLLDKQLNLPTGKVRKDIQFKFNAWSMQRMGGDDEKLLAWFRVNCIQPSEKPPLQSFSESDHGPIPDQDFNDRHQPEYPQQAISQHHEGTATVLADLDAAGHVVKVRIESTSGFKELDDAAKNAAETWRFEAAIKGGKKIPSVVRLPINFNLHYQSLSNNQN